MAGNIEELPHMWINKYGDAEDASISFDCQTRSNSIDGFDFAGADAIVSSQLLRIKLT